MKLIQKLLGTSLLSISLGSAQAVTYTFDSPTYTTAGFAVLGGPDLHGQDGWAINAPNLPTVGSLPSQLSTFFNVTGNASDLWGGLGGAWATPNSRDVELSHSAAVPLAYSALRMDLNIIKYPPAGAPLDNLDKFGWTLRNGGSDLIRIAFEPKAGTPSELEVAYYVGGGAKQTTGKVIGYNSTYAFDLSFLPSGISDASFTLNMTGAGSFTTIGTLPGVGAANITSLNADFDVTDANVLNAGLNTMSFNNLSIPEPSSILTAGLAFLGLIVRRRR